MMTQADTDEIRYSGAPTMTRGGRDVLAFHLHRYLATWLERHHRRRTLVTVGFEQSQVHLATFRASIAQCEAVEVAWTFEDLCRVYRQGDGRLHVEQRKDGGQTMTYDLVPLVDAPAAGGQPRVLLGFVLVNRADALAPDAAAQLAAQATEAIRAARRNLTRLFFDDNKALPLKQCIYQLMDRLAEWTGCDHSAALLMTSSLDAMTPGESAESRFDFVAERLYHDPAAGAPRRLVGMSVDLADREGGFLSAAVRRQHRRPDWGFQIFRRPDSADGDRPNKWRALDGDRTCFDSFHGCGERADESMYVLVPLVVDEDAEAELLGFLTLVYKSPRELSASTGTILEHLGDKLADLLRYSPLFALSARKLWVLNQTRAALEAAIAESGPARDRIEDLIGDVTALVADYVDVPSFAVAYLCDGDDDGDQALLRYAHPHGWTHFEQLNLPVEVAPDARVDSGISSLAVRINRPLVLAGGRGKGDSLAFKNYLFVDETRGNVVDARAPGASSTIDDGDWVRLSDYYKPARSSAYATLAYPIAFDGRPLGVITIEVERSTDWMWWTGFGARLFWDLLARDLAYAFHALGVDGSVAD